MDIDKLAKLATLSNPIHSKKKANKNTPRKPSSVSFSNMLQQSADREAMLEELPGLRIVTLNGTETIEELLDDVMKSGEELKKNNLMEPLKNYRKAVGRFLLHVLDKTIKVEVQAGKRDLKTMSQKKYSVIKVVDKKLDDLAACILNEQADNLEILGKIDEINGIIVDLAC